MAAEPHPLSLGLYLDMFHPRLPPDLPSSLKILSWMMYMDVKFEFNQFLSSISSIYSSFTSTFDLDIV